jgi:predicted N-acyltransferase
MNSIKIVDNIAGVSKEEWDSLIGNNVFASHGWLKTAEETFIGDIDPRYILVKNRNRLIGAAACYIFNKSELVENLDDLMFGRVKKCASIFGISFTPGFVCCPLLCQGSHLLIKGEIDLQNKKTIMKELLGTIEEIAARRRLAVSFIHVTDDESELIELLANRGYAKSLHVPSTYLDIEWRSFKEYRNALKKKVSRKIDKAIRWEMNRNRKEGVVIKALKYPDRLESLLYELLNKHYYRHNRRPFMFRRGFLKSLKQALGEDVVFYVAFKNGVIAGVCILLKRNKVGYISMVGVDHKMAGNDYTYFNIAYYKPIIDAISDQTTRLYYDRGVEELKARRGCVAKNLYIYYKSFNPLKNVAVRRWFAVLSAWNRFKMPERVRKRLRLKTDRRSFLRTT